MSYRIQIALLFALPVLLVGALYAVGAAIPVPVLGRDYVVRVDLPQASDRLDLPEIEGPSDPSRPLVVIDAGHGGPDLGATSNGYLEKQIVLGLARELRDRLLEEGGIRVAMTRDDDTLIVLQERAVIARDLGADLFLSIHADSAGEREGVAGASIYTLSETASSEAAARFAERENEADIINGVDLSGQDEEVNAILVELSQRRTSSQSAEFAALIEREGEGVLRFHPQAQRSAALAVLRAPDVPSVLFESGFITNREDAALLASAEGQAQFAEVMARAIRIYFARQSNAQ
ncbi:N-acetylmuramoyl-L-alanine amidase family protein [Aurantiacibacter gangjinensis]|uniref:N-acetylmuramoyl-L-alanine amidase n=1 Tax=Aurantiacibacter gangjinensis TaxID=502682 RepID=A0A0G9MQK5_9SPHN|nr:N-acetylmuramoyl-L-alanine amidase [Aurantiacibacter gangjinensis]APE28857.1 N-acetylmuramoyl-L-alanine amidase [Aurantiacibacter gangjinensis]KLE32995.1 N-acetylmuramoyl-L-alanine amidase [Aurantiacibacter gangjinensis]